jgi:serine/threonine protein kinase
MLRRTFLDDQAYYMVMERCKKSVMDVFEERGPAFPDFPRVIREMLTAVAHVHRRGAVHRDVKPNNFLLGGPDGKTVKLCDFGMAVRMPRKGLLKDSCGTASYMSPEMLRGKGYGQSTDVWSLGVSAYVLVFGALPYVPKGEQSPEAMKDIILLGHPKPSFAIPWRSKEGPPMEELALVRELLARNPNDRPTADAALELPHSPPQADVDFDDCKGICPNGVPEEVDNASTEAPSTRNTSTDSYPDRDSVSSWGVNTEDLPRPWTSNRDIRSL